MKSIVVGIDGSAGSAEALRWAVEEASLHDAHVTALRCWGGRNHLSREGWDDELAAAQRRADEALSALVTAVVPDAVDLVDRLTIDARPEWGLLAAAADADLLVVGARGISGIKGLVVGSVSQQVIHHAHVPVAVVRDTRWPALPHRVVVGVDGSDASERALAWAIEEARRRDAEVEAIHAWTLPHAGSPFGHADVERDEVAARERLAAAVERADTTGLDRPVRQTVVQGVAGSVIVEAASRADLVVVGFRGLGGFKELLLGSVGQHVAHHAPCPTIVIRPELSEGSEES